MRLVAPGLSDVTPTMDPRRPMQARLGHERCPLAKPSWPQMTSLERLLPSPVIAVHSKAANSPQATGFSTPSLNTRGYQAPIAGAIHAYQVAELLVLCRNQAQQGQ
jgi:hypothetical protein